MKHISTREANEALQTAQNALYGALNIEGPANMAGDDFACYAGLDVPVHFERIRAAIKKIEVLGITFE